MKGPQQQGVCGCLELWLGSGWFWRLRLREGYDFRRKAQCVVHFKSKIAHWNTYRHLKKMWTKLVWIYLFNTPVAVWFSSFNPSFSFQIEILLNLLAAKNVCIKAHLVHVDKREWPFKIWLVYIYIYSSVYINSLNCPFGFPWWILGAMQLQSLHIARTGPAWACEAPWNQMGQI